MHAILASMILLSLPQAPQQSLLREIIPNPTGRNGYEEYLMACDVVRSTRVAELLVPPEQLRAVVRDYESSERPVDEWNEKLAKPNLERYLFAKKHQDLSQLQLRREAVRVAGSALDLLAKGNRKQVLDPRAEKKWDTTFPEFAQMRLLARLVVAGAYVAYADGQPARGNQYLMDSFEFGHRIGNGILIARLVGAAIQSTTFQAYEMLLPLMTAVDARKIIDAVPSWIPNPPVAVAALDSEFAFMQRNLAGMFDQVEDANGVLFNDERKSNAEKTASDFLGRMTLADKQRVIQICNEHLVKQRQKLGNSYRRPESEWDIPVEVEAEYLNTRAVRSADDFGEFVSSQITPAFTQVGSLEVRTRTQFRLLRLSAAVVRYKWEHDKFPLNLVEAVGEDNMADPASGEKFQYEVLGNGFRVWSKGTARTGEIGLKYVRTQAGDEGTPPPV